MVDVPAYRAVSSHPELHEFPDAKKFSKQAPSTTDTCSDNGSDTYTYDSPVTSSSASADPTLTSASTPTSVFLSDEHEA
ncbi:hypothetical protein Gpo141_00012431, partial [Globisporangium polare]